MIEADNENKMKVDIENERDRLAKNHDTDFIRKFLGYSFVTQVKLIGKKRVYEAEIYHELTDQINSKTL